MHIAQSERISAVVALDVPSNIRDFLERLDAPGTLRAHFEPPSRFYDRGWPDAPGAWPELPGRLLPLWEHSGAVFAVDLEKQAKQYLYFYTDFPEEPIVVGRTIHDLLFEMLSRHVWEYGGSEMEVLDCLRFAERLQFPDMSALSILLSNPNASDLEVQKYKARFFAEAQA